MQFCRGNDNIVLNLRELNFDDGIFGLETKIFEQSL